MNDPSTASPPQPLDTDDVLELLDQLGKDAESVADSLQRLGILGIPQNPNRCPIANYLTLKTQHQITIDATFIQTEAGSILVDYPHMPLAIARFIDKFDAGSFPQLAVPPVNP